MAKTRYKIEKEIDRKFEKIADEIYMKYGYWVSWTLKLSKYRRKPNKKLTPKRFVDDYFKKHKLKTGR